MEVSFDVEEGSQYLVNEYRSKDLYALNLTENIQVNAESVGVNQVKLHFQFEKIKLKPEATRLERK